MCVRACVLSCARACMRSCVHPMVDTDQTTDLYIHRLSFCSTQVITINWTKKKSIVTAAAVKILEMRNVIQ